VSGGPGAPHIHGHQFTEIADEDVEDILRETGKRFGPRQRDLYAELIDRAAQMVAMDTERLGSRDRHELGEGIRSFHMELAAGRRGAASHVLYYLRGWIADGGGGVIIVRVLHERMEPARHVSQGLE
jgi:toxin ParE1/3/4